MVGRYITIADGRKVPLGIYVAAIKRAKSEPETTFRCGPSFDFPCTGAEVVAQFMEGVHDRITQGVSYTQRGV